MLGGRTRLSAGPARYSLSPLSFGARQLALLLAVARGEAELKTAGPGGPGRGVRPCMCAWTQRAPPCRGGAVTWAWPGARAARCF